VKGVLTVLLGCGLLLPGIISEASAEEVVLDPFVHERGVSSGELSDALLFSNTQTWDRALLKHKDGRVVYAEGWQKQIVLPKPPANSSIRTRRELDMLLQRQNDRTDQDTKDIEAELNLRGFTWGDIQFADCLNNDEYPATRELLLAANQDLYVVLFTLKHHFDRVRPAELEPRLQPCIDVPDHPAYPSGHSTLAHVFGYLFQELVPEQGEVIRRDAARIAQNREIAGVHYPSDSDAGRLLARQLVDLLLANPEFQKLLDAARAEW